MSTKIRVRYPPSPTGYCHIGTARMALLNYLFAKKNGGEIHFRIEDTDKERSSQQYEEDIIESFQWLGLTWDEFHRQSDRIDVYVKALKELLAADKAYISEEPSKKDPSVLVGVVRLRNPGTTITFTDIIRGDITFDTTELKDFIIARSVDDPLYHFTVVVDDALMGITHVIRGEDHISNTPRQILIQEAFGYERPQYAHYPLNLNTDRSKLSKRTGDVAVRIYREKGFLPHALINYLATVGWTPPSGREFLSVEELVHEFELDALHKSAGVFDIEKLRWFNRHYLLELSASDFENAALPVLAHEIQKRELEWDEHKARAIVPIIRDRISVCDDLRASVQEGEFDYFFAEPRLDTSKIPGKGSDAMTAKIHLAALQKLTVALPLNASMTPEDVKEAVWSYAEREGRGKVLWPFRYALTGREKSPDPFTVAAIIGKEAIQRRIETARTML